MPIFHSIYYTHSDKGKASIPLLLIHGAGGSTLSWPPQIRRLADNTVYAIDLPGHGNSPGVASQKISEYSQILLEWLEKFHIKQVNICGHSMGGAIAMHMAINAPSMINQLIVISSAARLKVNPQLLDLAAHPATYPKAIEIMLNWSFSENASPMLIQQTMKRLLSMRHSVLYNDLIACDSFDIQSEISSLNCPTLFICGSLDKMTPPRVVKLLSQSIPMAQYLEIPESGHMVTLEQPLMVAKAMVNFLS
ncbi:MAG: alpha/beta fold hydrolase [Anaerolineales bacterium]